jgi:hypothetical protein
MTSNLDNMTNLSFQSEFIIFYKRKKYFLFNNYHITRIFPTFKLFILNFTAIIIF